MKPVRSARHLARRRIGQWIARLPSNDRYTRPTRALVRSSKRKKNATAKNAAA